jgi:cytochrome c-type biogenesis protein
VESVLFATGTAFWLGVLTSISPCPLATNVAAVSFISSRFSDPRRVLASGLAYTLGRMVAYLLVGLFIVLGFLSIPGLSSFLQSRMNQLLGPILVVTAMILLKLIEFDFSFGVSADTKERSDRGGLTGAAILGFLFALSFCPISGALFFAGLVPLSVHHKSPLLMPALFGVGTAVPVIAFAIALAFGASKVVTLYERMQEAEAWARKGTGIIFLVVGVWYSLRYTLELF